MNCNYLFLFVFLAYVCLLFIVFVVCGWLVKHKVKMPLSLH